MTYLPVNKLNVAHWSSNSVVNGPGVRFVVWLQGCPIHCPGCINPELQSFQTVHLMGVEELASTILNTEGIEGVTISGGEPTVQAESLVPLINILKSHGLGVMCYSGYRLDELEKSRKSTVHELLASLDILIDGPYLQDQAERLIWRGSRNQQVHFMTERYAEWAQRIDQPKSMIELKAGNLSWSMTGTWQDEFISRLQSELNKEFGRADSPTFR